MTQTQAKPPASRATVEVFRSGTFRPLAGAEISYSAADLRAIADAYDPETAPAPIVVGHPTTDAPAFGWIEKLTYDASSDRLVADLHEIHPEFAAAVQEGRYKKVSMAFFKPDHPANPVPGTWYPKHVGFLGGAAPAVSGLKNAAFSAGADASVVFAAEFGDRTAEAAAGLLRSLRDFLIEKFGMDAADKALPSWNIEWLGESGDPMPAYATTPEPNSKTPESIVPTTPDPAFAAREAELNARAAEIAVREANLVEADNVAFADALVADGKLLPASKSQLVDLLGTLHGTKGTVSFAEGDAVDPATAVRRILSAQPKVVTFGAIDDPGAPASTRSSVDFAADGRPVDTARLALHNKALDYQRQHPGTEYIAAVKAVS